MPPSVLAPDRVVPNTLGDLLRSDAEYAERDLPLGCMGPTHRLVPAAPFTHGHDAVELADIAGYDLMEFQRDGLVDKLGAHLVERRDGTRVERWTAQETADVIARRNGKSLEIEILILVGLFVLGERQIMYTAHKDDTAGDVFDNVRAAIERTPALRAEMARNGFRVTNGQRQIRLRNGATAYFRTRTNEAARGRGFNRLILDEAQHLTEAEMAAVMPVVTGAENAQINYAASAGGLHSTVLGKVWRSFEAGERGLCYRGWHADTEADFDSLALVARMNPRLGRGLSYEFVAKEFHRMTRADFGRERCGAATYPRQEGAGWVIPEAAWASTVDVKSAIADDQKPRFVLEADPELSAGTVGVAGRRADAAMHLEVLAHDPGVWWMVARAKQLQDEHGGEVWLDGKGPLEFMLGDLREAGVKAHLLDASDLRDAWAWLYTAANPKPDPADPGAGTPTPTVRQRGEQLMTQALAAAEVRKLLNRWSLKRVVSGDVNQGPIIAPMLAGYAVVKSERRKPPPPLPQSAGKAPGTRENRARTNPTADLTTANF